MKEKEIVIINQDSGYLMIDIANAFVEKGYRVSLITGRLVKRNIPLNESVKISKILKYNRKNTLMRLFSGSFASVQIVFLLWTKYRKKNLLIVSNPPVAPLIPLVTSNKFSLLIYDIFPDALINFKVFKKNSFLIQKWETLNKKIYNKAEKVFTITEGMKNVLTKYVDDKNIKVVPIWTDNNFLKPINKHLNPFVKKNGLEGKFTVLYSGSLGAASNTSVLVDIAEQVKDSNIQFVIIGEGTLKNKLFDKVKERSIQNCKFLPWQEVSDLPFSMASADLSVVSIGNNASKLAIPSKLFNYLSVGSPILCLSDRNSDVAKLVNRHVVGVNFEPKQISEIVSFINSISNDKLKLEQMRKNALTTSGLFTSENAYSFIK